MHITQELFVRNTPSQCGCREITPFVSFTVTGRTIRTEADCCHITSFIRIVGTCQVRHQYPFCITGRRCSERSGSRQSPCARCIAQEVRTACPHRSTHVLLISKTSHKVQPMVFVDFQVIVGNVLVDNRCLLVV